MTKTLLVAWGQIKKIVLNWSFLIIICYPPLLILVLGAYAGIMAGVASLNRATESPPAPGVVVTNDVAFARPVGLVDPARLIQTIPPDLASEKLRPLPDEAAALAALQSGQIAGYYLIPADYVASGLVTYFSPDNVQFTRTDDVIRNLLTVNLALADGEPVARRLVTPVTLDRRLVTVAGLPAGAPETYTAAEVGIGVGIALFVYFTIGSVCGTFLHQLAQEREGRVLEVVLSGLSARQLLTGKFIGILVVGLVETGAWLFWARLFGLAGAQLSSLGGGARPGPAAFDDPGIFLLSALIYIGGYFAYTATAAVFGALVSDGNQASRVNFVLVLAALSPLIWLISVLSDRNGALAIGLSFFPLTAPVILPLRLFITPVPIWQVGLSLAALLAWTVLMLWLAAGLFQARLLLSDAPLRQLIGSWGRTGR